MDKGQLEALIVETLKGIGKYSPEAVRLLLGTAAQESKLGYYIRQLGSGPALGIFQMEPNTFYDICNRYLVHKKELRQKILVECNIMTLKPEMLVYNLKLAICFTRVHYLRKPAALPFDLKGMAEYWKLHYNTIFGSGTEKEFINNYKKYVS